MALTKTPIELSSTPGIVDNSNATAITIDSSENVGIGTGSPTFTLEVNGGGAADNLKVESQSTLTNFYQTTTGGTTVFQNNNGKMAMYTGGTERMSIDSSGNVKINAAGSLLIRDDGSFIKEAGGLQIGNTSGTGTTRPILFYTESAERMRIDSSGNLLVGISAAVTSTQNTSDGVTFGKTYTWTHVSDAGGQYVQRQNAGNFSTFYQGTTNVGSIGTAAGGLYIADAGVGFRFDSGGTDDIIPCNATGGAADASINLGSSGARFNDLYLSGGVYLGGTGSANKLDDYEEGTFTPTFVNIGNGTYSVANGRYIKIGNQCTCYIYLSISVFGTASGSIVVGGLPFNAFNVNGLYGSTSAVHGTGWTTPTAGLQGLIGAGQTIVTFYENMMASSSSSAYTTNMADIGTGNLLFSVTYKTA